MSAHARWPTALVLAALASAAGAAAPTAPAPAPEVDPAPVAAVRELYRRNSVRAYDLYSDRLKALFVDADTPGEGGRLEFAFHVNGQEVEDGWQATLRLELASTPAPETGRAVVRVTFRSGGPQELRYVLVRERGRWVIDDAESLVPNRWVLSRILAKGQ